MKVLVIGGDRTIDYAEEQGEAYAQFFSEALAINQSQAAVDYCFLDDLAFWVGGDTFSVSDTRHSTELNSYDMIIFRGKLRKNLTLASTVSRYAKAHNLRFWNDYSAYRSTSKLLQAVIMHELQLPTPATLACDNPDELIALAAKHLSYPFIAKDSYGSHGEVNFLVQDEAELRLITRQHPDVSFVLQEYIPNDADYRILVVGNRHLIIERRAAGDSHLNNTSQGGSAAMVNEHDFPAQTLEQAHRFANDLGMSIAGVDAIRDKETGNMYFLEINSQPQLMSGAFLAEKRQLLAEFIAG